MAGHVKRGAKAVKDSGVLQEMGKTALTAGANHLLGGGAGGEEEGRRFMVIPRGGGEPEPGAIPKKAGFFTRMANRARSGAKAIGTKLRSAGKAVGSKIRATGSKLLNSAKNALAKRFNKRSAPEAEASGDDTSSSEEEGRRFFEQSTGKSGFGERVGRAVGRAAGRAHRFAKTAKKAIAGKFKKTDAAPSPPATPANARFFFQQPTGGKTKAKGRLSKMKDKVKRGAKTLGGHVKRGAKAVKDSGVLQEMGKSALKAGADAVLANLNGGAGGEERRMFFQQPAGGKTKGRLSKMKDKVKKGAKTLGGHIKRGAKAVKDSGVLQEMGKSALKAGANHLLGGGVGDERRYH